MGSEGSVGRRRKTQRSSSSRENQGEGKGFFFFRIGQLADLALWLWGWLAAKSVAVVVAFPSQALETNHFYVQSREATSAIINLLMKCCAAKLPNIPTQRCPWPLPLFWALS